MISTQKWKTRLSDEMIRRYSASKQWTNTSLVKSMRQCCQQFPDRTAVVDGVHTLTFAQVFERAQHLASSLQQAGLTPGDVISFQLPNWHEAIEINIAACLCGLIVNPIIPIYRDSEVRFILRDARAKLIFVPETFRGFSYLEMMDRIHEDLPDLQAVVVVRPEISVGSSYEMLISAGSETPLKENELDPNDIKLLLYTSGTTGDPKGVLHSHNTLRSDIDSMIRFRGLTKDDIALMPSPVTHITGYLYALELPFVLGMTVVLMDKWKSAEAVRLMQEHRVTVSNGATPFLAEIVAELERTNQQLPLLRMYATGGAPVPPELVRRALRLLPNCRIFRAYGCSEAPTVSAGLASGDPIELGIETDGLIYNHEVKIIDPDTREQLGINCSGEILTRGPEVMIGYTNPVHTEASFDEEGFFRTGDLGFINEKGYITITGRIKDLIIRGGENLSPKEIEDVLYQHPSVKDVAVVPMPHPRMGETPCACIVLKEGATLGFDEMCSFLESAKLAKQKFPERLMLFSELPRNAAGKILKQELKKVVADAYHAEQAASAEAKT